MTLSTARPKHVVLVGAGHAHVQALRLFGIKPHVDVQLTLITREAHTPYSGMLPGLVSRRYSFDEAHINVAPLARFAGAELRLTEAVGLDIDARAVVCRDGPPVAYDVLSIDIGSRPNTFDVAGAADHAIPVKPIDGFLARFDALVRRVLERGARARIVLVSAGAGGVELILATRARLRREASAAGLDPDGLRFCIIAGANGLLPDFPIAFRERFARLLEQRGINVRAGARVARVEKGGVCLDTGARIEADEILWTTEAAAAPWLKDTGLACDVHGFLRVDAMLRCLGHDNIFAVGDIANFTPRPLPKSGVYAVRAGPVLAHNIRAFVAGGRLKPFRPQRHALYLVGDGEDYAIGARNGLTVSGAWVWRWKDRIDRRFMEQFNRLA